MKKYLQIHMLTSYPPSNLNRDDLGRPKTALIGGTNRLRISSQSLKRAWRTSEVFQEKLGKIKVGGKMGLRTKRIGRDVFEKLLAGGIKDKDATLWTRNIVQVFGKNKSDKELVKDIKNVEESTISASEKKSKITEIQKGVLDIEQLAFISPEEQIAIFALVDELIQSKKAPTNEQLDLLRKENSAADVAMFGRMLASHPINNIEAAVQVAHAFSVQKITVEDDFFTAVDDLNRGEEEMGAGHMGDVEFASGVYYLYINIDRQLLLENLQGAGKDSKKLLDQTIQALVESAATVAPTGKQNTFASRARAHYLLAELGDQQPRSLALAYVKAVSGDIIENAVNEIETLRNKMDKAYGACSDDSFTMNVLAEKGTLADLLSFCVGD